METDFELVTELAVSMVRVTTREKVREVTWLPFTLLYDELLKRGEITPIKDLDLETKRKYWNETEKNWKSYKRIFICQALYVFDLITK